LLAVVFLFKKKIFLFYSIELQSHVTHTQKLMDYGVGGTDEKTTLEYAEFEP